MTTTKTHRGRAPLPDELKTRKFCCNLPPHIIDAITINSPEFGSQAKYLIAAVEAFVPGLHAEALHRAKEIAEVQKGRSKETPATKDLLKGIAPELLANLPPKLKPAFVQPATGKPKFFAT